MGCRRCGYAGQPEWRFCGWCGAALGAAHAPDAGEALPVGVNLQGRYTITGAIARGGMSTLYLARDARFTSRVCVVKEMLDHITGPLDRVAAARAFHEEADLLARLRHPAIPAVYDRFDQDQRHYLIMEYIEGEDLDDVLAHRGHPCAEPEARAWASQLCDALGYLHALTPPVIFRDLKPRNVMLDRQGHIRLVDFGIARLFKHGQARDTVALGTTGYASPEHYRGQTGVPSDIYSLGATLHHLLSGRDPACHTPFTFPPLRTLNASVSPEMETLIAAMLHLTPAARPQSMREIAATLAAMPPVVVAPSPPTFTRPAVAHALPTRATSPTPPCLPGILPALPPRLVVAPIALDFGAVTPDQYATRTLSLRNAGGATLRGTLTASAPWLSVSPTSFVGNEQQIHVTLKTPMLPALGPRHAAILINTNGGTYTLPIRLVAQHPAAPASDHGVWRRIGLAR